MLYRDMLSRSKTTFIFLDPLRPTYLRRLVAIWLLLMGGYPITLDFSIARAAGEEMLSSSVHSIESLKKIPLQVGRIYKMPIPGSGNSKTHGGEWLRNGFPGN